jgi:hypothetical protein
MLESRVSSPFDGVRPARKLLILWTAMILAVAWAIGLASVGLASPVPQEQAGGGLGPGCAPNRPAVAHKAGGVPASSTSTPHKEGAPPIPCVTRTGARTGEVTVVVTNAGAVLFRPAWETQTAGPPIGVIRSEDRGSNWDTPNTPTGDTNMWVDRKTGRVFWMTSGSTRGGILRLASLSISDDDGKTWYSGGQAHVASDHVQVFGGPPIASMKKLLQGYPSVVYACMGHKPMKCEKSQDGGMSWGPELNIPFPPGLEAIQGPAHDCSDFGLQGVVGRDGTVYVPYGPCNRPYVAVSHDEGGTWTLVAVANTDEIGYGYPALGIDEQDNLYATWVGVSDRLPYMAISRDHGMHWGQPLMIGAPGVNEAAIPSLVAGPTGQVAVTYYGTKNAPLPFPPVCYVRAKTPEVPGQATPSLGCPGYDNEKWDTYVTESWNALDREPLFWSATLNDPSQPTWYGCSPSEIGVVRMDEDFNSGPNQYRGCSPLQSRFDYLGATMAPDGTVWVGFAQECPFGRPVPDNPNCPVTLTGSGPDGLLGLVGRLIPPGEHPR